MERELWHFEQKWSGTVEDGPEQPKQTQRAVRELFLRLPSTFRPPVLILPAKVRCTLRLISEELKLLKLWHRDLQRLGDLAQPRIAGAIRSARDLLKEIRPKGITASRDVAIRFPNELRDEMKIPDRSEKLRQFAEFTVYVDLFNIGLVQSCGVLSIFVIRSVQDRRARQAYDFLFQDGALSIVLAEADLVSPLRTVCASGHRHCDLDVGVAPGCEAAKLRYAAPIGDRFFEAPADGNQIVQEPKSVEEIGFP